MEGGGGRWMVVQVWHCEWMGSEKLAFLVNCYMLLCYSEEPCTTYVCTYILKHTKSEHQA